MSARIISSKNDSITLQVTVQISNSMLASEEAILEAVNDVGNFASLTSFSKSRNLKIL